LWGGMESCRRLEIAAVRFQIEKEWPIANRPQPIRLPHHRATNIVEC
jgi:hypothetical protein